VSAPVSPQNFGRLHMFPFRAFDYELNPSLLDIKSI
jgi:hypothetical protein